MKKFMLGLLFIALLALAACGPFAPADPTAVPTSAPKPPAAVATTAPAAAATTPAAVAPATARPAGTPAAGATSAPAAASPADAVKIVFADDSEARYRVREQLAGVSLPNDAVGRTKAISGQIVARPDGSLVPEQSKITVEVSTLKSDDNRRDNFLRTSVLETARYTQVTFVPTSAKGLVLPLQDGTQKFQLMGDLTVRNVTKPVTWDVTLEIKGGEARGAATTSFTFATFNIQKPNVPVVLSVEDTIKLELDMHLKRSS